MLKSIDKQALYAFCSQVLLDAQFSEYNKKLATQPKTYDSPRDNTNSTPTAAPHLHSLYKNRL